MALAPRPTRAESERGGKRSSVASSTGKAAQRARNGNATRSGSSGAGLAVRSMPGLDWDEIERSADHLTDIAAKISHTQVGSSGTVTATLNIPLAYLHQLVHAHQESLAAMVYIRVYHVPMERFLEEEAEDDGEEGGE